MKAAWALAILCVVAGCAHDAAPTSNVQEYAYRHWATTGIQESIRVNGRDVFIVFTKDSDLAQRESLWKLDSGAAVMIEGELLPKIHRTPSGPQYAQPEPYQEFRLIRWQKG